MAGTILTLAIACERDTVAARQRARQLARLLGFEGQDQTRISTAVSEIARNAFNYAGGGRVEYSIEGRTAPQLFMIKIKDSGPGVRDLEHILEGRYQSQTGMGMGILGARRLMDQFQIESEPGKGTTIWLKKLLPRSARVWKPEDLPGLAAKLANQGPQDAFQELQHQNQELLNALEEIRTRQIELSRLNRELEDTNRGVVALYAELDEKADHLRRADELKTRFLSNMSHEFRSPLNSILALSGLLLNRSDGELTPEQEQQAEFIRRAARDLLDLVNDLLDMAKVEAGKVEAKPVEFRVSDLFAALRGMLRPLLLNQAVDLVFEDVEAIPAMFSDEGKISQILRNFISNSLKFTERGEVRVSASLAGNDVVFCVADTGIGIAVEDQQRIFLDFAQVDHPIQRRVKGTGLGLPLSKKLATLLGGEVRVQSQAGVGSAFTVQLPLRYEQSVDLSLESESAIAAAEDSGSMPILVLEDKLEMMMMYRSYLKNTGFQLIPASTVREAQEVLERLRPRVMILDVVLRSEDSWRFLADLKKDARTRDIPVVIASTIEDQAKAFHLGADDYLLKPVERAPLMESLEQLTAPRLARILIVDDEERDRYLLKQYFRELGVVIQEASGGAEGLREAAREAPDAIILDLSMPGMSGFEVLDALKTNAATTNIPVVICTSHVLTEAERLQLAGRAIAILSKGGQAQEEIADVVRRAVSQARLPVSAISRSA
jgi:signal transduction histidine kinase/DNA-binding response OmpR family regulator